MKKIFDKTMIKFLIVGVINTLFGSAIMFGAYNILNLSYWVSSALNYILAGILSYILNKHFTFRSEAKGIKPIIKFIINALICYAVGYGIAKPLVALTLSGTSQRIQENGAMLVGMCIYTALNYLGQRFFAFRDANH